MIGYFAISCSVSFFTFSNGWPRLTMTLRLSWKQGSMTRFGKDCVVSVPMAMSACPASTNSQTCVGALSQADADGRGSA